MQDSFVDETGLDFSFIFILYEGGDGSPAKAKDCKSYAETIGDPSFPVMADGQDKTVDATPMDKTTHPEICAFSPEFEILECFRGHGTIEAAFDVVRAHAGI